MYLRSLPLLLPLAPLICSPPPSWLASTCSLLCCRALSRSPPSSDRLFLSSSRRFGGLSPLCGMSDGARYTCSSNYSKSSTSNRSESLLQEVRIRGSRKTSPTPSLAASSDYVDYVDETKESVKEISTTKAAPAATQALPPEKATPLQPTPTHKPWRPTHNTPATNESTTYKAKSRSRPPTTRTPRDATKMTHRPLDEVHTLHDRFHRASLRFGRTTDTQINTTTELP